MSTMAINGAYHLDASQGGSKPSSPASPSATFQNQQQPRSFIHLNQNVRGQTSPFPSTPTSALSASILEPPAGVQYTEFIRSWTDNHVARWLTDIKCGAHASTFKANDIRGDILLELDQVTLKEMGISSIGDRLRIINAVKNLRQKFSASQRNSTSAESRHSRSGSVVDTSQKNDTATGAARTRRLVSGRPAPLQLEQTHSRNDLPRIVREQGQPDSARLANANNFRPLPHPAQNSQVVSVNAPAGGANGTPNSNHSVGPYRSNLPPLPPAPRIQPPQPPPARPTNRTLLSNGSSAGRRTPTQGEAPAYTSQALPPAPSNQSPAGAVLTPTGWSTYHLPADPRPGNAGPRSTSPLAPGRNGNRPGALASHGRNVSLGVTSPSSAGSPHKLPPRPSTSNSHPYANAAALQPPTSSAYNLSPIAESFMSQHSSSSSPSPPTGSSISSAGAYSVGRGPFNPGTPLHANTPSLDDLRRKLVKFLLPDEGHSCTIDAATCAGGVELLEKVLKKFGKTRSPDSDIEHVQIDGGGLIVDGWGVFFDGPQEDGQAQPLTEAELCSICHSAPPDHPAREHGLILRKLHRSVNSASSSRFLGIAQSPMTKATKRASSISILSGLGVRDPEKALDSLSPTQAERPSASPLSSAIKRPSKLRNFFGQRPPSELITTHLTEYFPFTEKKVLERTARHSMMRMGTLSGRRESTMSTVGAPSHSRFSVSTQGSSQNRTSIASTIPPPPLPDKDGESGETPLEEIPRVSLSTDDGHSIDLREEDEESPSRADAASDPGSHAELLPPIPFPTESLSESMMEGFSQRPSRPVSRAMSTSSKRMSYMTELRSKRDRSDTASMMTVDEITAEVESRRESRLVEHGFDSDEWTKVESAEGVETEVENLEGTLVDTIESGESEDEESTLNDELAGEPEDVDEDDDEPGKPVRSRAGIKWIKGALIGAGSFGKVYLGMDASNGLLMAVKQVELPTGDGPNIERKKSMLSALEREIELLKDLQHENIVQYLYSSTDDEFLNIFLEYVPGGSVTALLRSYGAFEEPLVKNFVRQILQGLNYLHERDIIHRDIKGANILVDNKGGIKISDFGISKKVEDNLLTGGNRMHRPSLQGSVFWMAPEVVKQTGHTRKADIWSVGCLVVEMLTGEHPWAQLTQMQAIFKIGSQAKPEIPSDISAEAQDFLLRTFELDHEARPSAAELLQHGWITKKPGSATKGGSGIKSNPVTSPSIEVAA
ncbi:hypothetical protein HGRIS_013023 [Hohenbuehelia grisea]|uniref:mitogen-activated protein kinase kinase kinase n=1 Tax=Hohenbuehelia grisea TaxID=104357 RepID=A0ABR3IUF5_9AGAR